MIHLDTSFLIKALVLGSTEDATLQRWIEKGERLALCTIAWTEFLCGPVTGEQAELAARIVPERLEYGAAHAALAAELFNATGRRRGSLVDCMIAAVALSAEAHLATVNHDDFGRFVAQGLVLA